MDKLEKILLNEDCFNSRARVLGNSDRCIQEIISIFLTIGNVDPLLQFNNSDFISICRTMFYDMKLYIPIDEKGHKVSKEHYGQELLPNGIFRKLIIYIIINIEQYTRDELTVLNQLFMSLEENNITGFMYISKKGRSIKEVIPILHKYKLHIGYRKYVNNEGNVEDGLILCNTVIVGLIRAIISKM
jgi:hypothetical protein